MSATAARLKASPPPPVDPREFLASVSDKIEGFFYRCRNDADYTMLHLSSGFDRMLGRASADLVVRGNSFANLVHPDDLVQCSRSIDAALEARRRWRVSYRLERADGAYVQVFETGGGVFDPNTGALLYLDGVVLDATLVG